MKSFPTGLCVRDGQLWSPWQPPRQSPHPPFTEDGQTMDVQFMHVLEPKSVSVKAVQLRDHRTHTG